MREIGSSYEIPELFHARDERVRAPLLAKSKPSEGLKGIKCGRFVMSALRQKQTCAVRQHQRQNVYVTLTRA
jgi:hypothetical protein